MARPLADRPEVSAPDAALVASRRADLARFDDLFDAYWRGRGREARRQDRRRSVGRPLAPALSAGARRE